MHHCTAFDFAKFNPVESKSSAKVQRLREANNWYCFEWDSRDDLDLYGTWKTGGSYGALGIEVRPCASRWTAFDGTVYGGGDECVWD